MAERRSPFGQLLREVRIAAGLSQEVLAERARVSVACISVLERGLRRSPHRETVAMLALALELSPRDCARLQAAAQRASVQRRLGPQQAHDAKVGDLNTRVREPLVTRSKERCAALKPLDDRLEPVEPGTDFPDMRRSGPSDETLFGNADPDGASYVELIAAAIAVALRYHDAEPDTASVAQLVDERLLIVLGNFGRVLGAASAVTQQIVERLSQRASSRDES